MAADSAAAAVGPEAGTLAMEAMEATAMAAEVPWASIGTFLLMFRGVHVLMMSGARGWIRMAKFRRFARKQVGLNKSSQRASQSDPGSRTPLQDRPRKICWRVILIFDTYDCIENKLRTL